MKLEVLDDADSVARAAAKTIAAEARAAIASRKRFSLAVSGGHTPWVMLRALADEDVPWAGVHLFQVDERIAPAGNPDRNLTNLRESFLQHVPLPPEQIHAMPVEATDLQAAAAAYSWDLEAITGSPAVLDLVHLGLGPDGHTASLLPGDPGLDVTAQDVALTGVYQGRRRMTLTYPVLNRARRILWVVTGGEKLEMLRRLREGDTSIPAGRVSRDHALVLADRAAAGERPLESSRPDDAGGTRTLSVGIRHSRCGPESNRTENSSTTEETNMNTTQAAQPLTEAQLDQLCINTIRTLSMDAVQQAKSGHPGTPMALAPLVYTIWNQVMHFDPADPIWPNRDRFVLSNGHASMLQWAILHLTQTQAVNAEYETLGKPSVTLDDIRRFRQLGSKAPGHAEYHWVSGVETTTGPLGQGVATSVGMAIGQKWLAARYNRPDFEIFNYRIYAVCGDGCMMEGIASEAASLAGHLGLDNLCWIYDNNHISIEGDTRITFTEDIAARFLGYGWNVLRVGDANDIDRIAQALDVFRTTKGRPTFIILDSHIGYGSPHKQDTAEAHGEPLGDEEIRLTKRAYGWPEDAKFLVPDGVYEHFAAGVGPRGAKARQEWKELCRTYQVRYRELWTEIEHMQRRDLPASWDRNLPVFPTDAKGIAGRDASSKVLNVLAQNIPWFLGGSADLAPSNKTRLTFEGAGDFQAATPAGRNLHFGIREHSMGAIVNGLSLSKIRAFGATFFIFSDYMRPAIRLSALMEIPSIFIFTHDAMGDGEDGPTHQPVEHLASLRAIPGLVTLRPGDANEAVEAYRCILQLRHKPAVLVLSRQPLPTLDRSRYAPASGVARGAYVLADAPGGNPEVILIASGSEVSLAVDAHEALLAGGIRSRVVSMPSWDIFEDQNQEYRDTVLPPAVKARIAIEQASTFGWERYVGNTGRVIGMKTFGASAPLKELQKEFGFEPETVVAVAKQVLSRA